ncbi:CHC2 zinc finger domain-containing protein [Desulfatibacillum aliphaticivorans]|uniref:CHC2 zinc finger domain-containing protein n=1 Tax=Desulfatibacillum aliphaticivorans TaxID=218208 RepID=UPI0004126D64|nr:CHC2 zinc finger domain-containing protein [Desulfatibacillum aliphaticivorans]
MKTCQDIKPAASIDAIIHYAEAMLGVRFTKVRKNRYNAQCPFHADTENSFRVYVNKDDEVRFHCFGACKGDWDIYDLIMLRRKCRSGKAQQVWAEHLGMADFKFDAGRVSSIPEPDETPEPDVPVVFIEPLKLDQKNAASLDEAASFYNGLLVSHKNRFKHIWEYLASRGVGQDAISKFNIGYAPPYSDEQHRGRALVDSFLPRFEKKNETFSAVTDAGLARLLNDNSVKGYGYYCRQIDFSRKYPFSRNYCDALAGRIVFPICDSTSLTTGLAGRNPGDRGVRWLKQQSREVPLSDRARLFGLEKAAQYIRQYRTIILVEGVFDYFAFYNLLQDMGKPALVSTLGSYVTPEAAAIITSLDIEHFIVAYNWDELGRNGIERMAAKSNGWVYYLGGPSKDQSPYDLLKPVLDAINGFSRGASHDLCAMLPKTKIKTGTGGHNKVQPPSVAVACSGKTASD